MCSHMAGCPYSVLSRRTLASPRSSLKCSCRLCSGWTALLWRMGPCRPNSSYLLLAIQRDAGSVTVSTLGGQGPVGVTVVEPSESRVGLLKKSA